MKLLLRGALIVFATLLLALVCLPLFIRVNDFKPVIENRLSQATARTVHLGDLSLAILSGAVQANDLTISDDPSFATTPFLKAQSLKVGVELAPLVFSRQIRITALTIEKPEINLLRNRAGKWNFSSLGKKPPAAAPPPATVAPTAPASPGYELSVRQIQIRDGRLSLKGLVGNSRPRVLEKLNAEVSDFSGSSIMPFKFDASVQGGGEIALNGKLGPIDRADTAATPGECSMNIRNLDLTGTGFVKTTSGFSAIASMDGNAKSDGHALEATGRLTLARLRLARGGSPAPQPVTVDFATRYETVEESGTLTRGEVHIGRASLSIAGTYDLAADEPALHLNLSGPGFPLPAIVAMLPALDVALPAGSSIEGGTAQVHLKSDGPANNLVTAGAVSAENVKLVGFDLGSKLSFLEKLAGLKAGTNTDLKSASADIRIAQQITNLQNIHAVAAGIGELTGSGTIGAHHELDFKMHANLQTTGALMTVIGQKGGTEVQFFITGTADHPVFKADIQQALVSGKAAKKVTKILKGFFGRGK